MQNMTIQCPRCNLEIETIAENGISYCRHCHKNFIFDKIAFSKYHTQWRKNNPEYSVSILNAVKTYQKNHPDRVRKTELKRVDRHKEILSNIFPRECFICGDKREEKFVYHQIYGQPHERKFKYVLDHQEDFKLLCYSCHHHIHWVMKHLHLTWTEMSSLTRNLVALCK